MYGFEATLNVSSAFNADVNYLPAVRAELKTTFPDAIHGGEEAKPVSVVMLSDSAFSVAFNPGTQEDAMPTAAGKYVLAYEGAMSYIQFTGSTTLTYFWCEYAVTVQDYYTAQFTVTPVGASVSVYSAAGIEMPVSADGSYELAKGLYAVTVSATGYVTQTVEFTVTGDIAVAVALQ